jgi:hypothetical protein
VPPDVSVLALDSVFDASRRHALTVAPGCSIADIVTRAYPALLPAHRALLRVTIGEQEVIPAIWAQVRPKPGAQLVIRPVPQGDIMRNVLSIAVTVGALALGQFYAPALAGALGIGNSLAQGLITGTALLAGTLLVNALVPPRQDAQNKPTYAIQGFQNQLTPDAPVPLILGKIRVAPVYAATPYTQAVGDERFVVAKFLWGYAPLVIRNLRIGETPIERFADVQIETRYGLPDEPPHTLYTKQVIEEALSVELKTPAVPTGGPQIRTTASDCTGCEIDITAPGGIFAVNKDGAYQNFTVALTCRYRRSGTDAWTAGPAISITSKKASALTRTIPITFPERGRYEIELLRTTIDWDEADQAKKEVQRHGRTVWSVLRSFRPEYPIDFDKPLVTTDVRIRATGQLNGMLDALNGDVVSICPDWDADSGTWTPRETNNPASLFRHVLTGPAITYPFTVDEVAALQDWHAFCVAKGLTYNRVHNYEASVLDVLSDIAAAGRASPHDSGTAWGVVIDRALDTVTAHISPRNSWGYQGERPYVILPHAFRISFLDETNAFARAERIVPLPGHTGPVTITEKLDLPGVTSPDQVWREGKRRGYEMLYRRDTHVVNQDFEALQVSRGDRAQLSHDVLDRTMRAARVRSVSGSTVWLDDVVEMEEGGSYAIRFRRADGSSLLRTIATVPGETQSVTLTGAGDAPAAGNLAFFGPAARESFAVTVKGIEAMTDLTARLTLIDHAPEIEALVDAEIPPPWSGRAGGEAQEPAGAPLVPIIDEIQSGRLAADAATPENPFPVVVLLRANPAETLPVASFQVQHRPLGSGGAYSTTTAAAAAGAVVLPGYDRGDEVELQGRAVGTNGAAGDWTAPLTHVVAATDPDAPSPPENLSAESPAPGVIRLRVTSGPSPQTVGVQFYATYNSSLPFSSASKFREPVASGPNVPLTVDFSGHISGPYRFWAVALDSLDDPIESVPVGPVDVTVS